MPSTASSDAGGWRSCAAARRFSAHAELREQPRALERAGDAEPHDARRRTAARSARPAKRIAPRSARRKPVTTLKKVLLPEPFGPITPTISPGRTSMAWFLSATRLRKDLVRPLVRSSGSAPKAPSIAAINRPDPGRPTKCRAEAFTTPKSKSNLQCQMPAGASTLLTGRSPRGEASQPVFGGRGGANASREAHHRLHL